MDAEARHVRVATAFGPASSSPVRHAPGCDPLSRWSSCHRLGLLAYSASRRQFLHRDHHMAGFTKTEFIWMNGELVPWEAAQVHVSAHALQYGTGVFEGMRSYDTADGAAIFRLDAHMRRLLASAEFYEIVIPYSVDELLAAALDVVRAN